MPSLHSHHHFFVYFVLLISSFALPPRHHPLNTEPVSFIFETSFLLLSASFFDFSVSLIFIHFIFLTFHLACDTSLPLISTTSSFFVFLPFFTHHGLAISISQFSTYRVITQAFTTTSFQFKKSISQISLSLALFRLLLAKWHKQND